MLQFNKKIVAPYSLDQRSSILYASAKKQQQPSKYCPKIAKTIPTPKKAMKQSINLFEISPNFPPQIQLIFSINWNLSKQHRGRKIQTAHTQTLFHLATINHPPYQTNSTNLQKNQFHSHLNPSSTRSHSQTSRKISPLSLN